MSGAALRVCVSVCLGPGQVRDKDGASPVEAGDARGLGVGVGCVGRAAEAAQAALQAVALVSVAGALFGVLLPSSRVREGES